VIAPRVWGVHTMYYGWGGGKRGTTHKKPGTTPRFFSWPRPPVRFYTVEALCRYVLFHSTPPLLLFIPHTRGALWKEHSKPGGDAKSPWTARYTPQSPLSSRISPVLPPLRSSCTEKFFSPNNLGIVPTTDYFAHPLTMLHKPACDSFSSASSPKESLLVWHTWTSPVQNRDNNVGHHTPPSLYNAYPCSYVAPRHKLPSF
jgi:hypothetical protein